MKKLAWIPTILYLTLVLGCGSSQNATQSPTYSNASFKGAYVFTLSGQCVTGCATSAVTQAVGVLAADGNGNITSGSLDVNAGGSYSGSPFALSGGYSVNSNGTGTLNLHAGGTSISGNVLLTSSSRGYLMTTGGPWALAGQLEKQSSSALTSALSGNFVFETSGLTSTVDPWGMAGVMNLGSNGVTADVNESGRLLYLQTGTIALQNYDATSGRGTIAISPSGAKPLPAANFIYYVVDGKTFELISSDSLGMRGRGEKSSGTVGSGQVLSGSYAFLVSGFPTDGVLSSDGGIFTGDGAGNITSGVIDTVDSTSSDLAEAFSATGSVSTVAGVSRDELALTTSSTYALTHPVAWFVSPSRAMVIKMNSNGVEAGYLDAQSAQTFANSGSFVFEQLGWDLKTVPIEALDNLTLLQVSGSQVSFSESTDLFGESATTSGSGSLNYDSTFTIGTIQLQNAFLGTETYRFYRYSPTDAYLMEIDLLSAGSGVLASQTAH